MTPIVLLILACGTERWDVKTLTDPAAASIPAEPVKTAVLALSEAIPPTFHPKAPRVAVEELLVLELEADVVGWKSEEDGDLHVVIQDAGRTMVVEFPAPECLDGARFKDEQIAARKAFLELVGAKSHPRKLLKLKTPIRVRLQGVGFFDDVHGQTGVAPNGIELHPVLSVQKAL